MVKTIKAHITGTIWKTQVRPGDRVSEDTIVTYIEAGLALMKVVAEQEGVIEKVLVTEHQEVTEGEVIATLGD